jgi:hypothetical protein
MIVNAEIEQIRTILNSIESKLDVSPNEVALRDFGALELPDILADVTDYLLPLLTPYEAAYYFFMFRHSILLDGTQYVRISTKKIRGIVASPRPGTGTSEGQIRDCLAALVNKGAIRKESEPNREGTIYKVLIPEEIDSCRFAMKAKLDMPVAQLNPLEEVDFYNVRENRSKIFERDGYVCQYCSKQLTRFTTTLDHIVPVSQGGTNSFENVTTACRECNSRKTGKSLGDFLADNPTLT